MKHKINVGDVLYAPNKNNIDEVVVCKVGIKYFYIANYPYRNVGFDIQTLKYNNNSYYKDSIQLYRSAQEIEDLKEISVLLSKLKREFNLTSRREFTLTELRGIDEILFPNSEKNNQ